MWVQLLVQIELLMQQIVEEQVGLLVKTIGSHELEKVCEFISAKIHPGGYRHLGILTHFQLIRFDDVLEKRAKLCNSWDLFYGFISHWKLATLENRIIK